jgi:hypothetical protein
MSKRFSWTTKTSVEILHYLKNHHKQFQECKKNNNTTRFYENAASIFEGCEGKTVVAFLKNTGIEYREVIKLIGQFTRQLKFCFHLQ